jgi:hypothetical protein
MAPDVKVRRWVSAAHRQTVALACLQAGAYLSWKGVLEDYLFTNNEHFNVSCWFRQASGLVETCNQATLESEAIQHEWKA